MTLDQLINGRLATLQPTAKEQKQGKTARRCVVLGMSFGQGGISLLVTSLENNGLEWVASYRVDFDGESKCTCVWRKAPMAQPKTK